MLLSLFDVSPQGSRGGAITGGAPPPQGSEFVGDVGDAIPHGSVGSVPHGPDAARERALGGGEGPAEQTAAAPAAAVAPQGSAAPSSIRGPCARKYILLIIVDTAVFRTITNQRVRRREIVADQTCINVK